MSRIKVLPMFVFLALLLVVAPSVAMAEEPLPPTEEKLPDGLDPNDNVGSAKFFTFNPITLEVIEVNEKSTQSGMAPEGLCIRTPLGPGRVYWKMSNPQGAGYSVKPETSNSLIWGAGSSQAIDGIYRSSWGNCYAYKVPDYCTVNWYSDDHYGECCNAAAALLYGRSRPADTCSSSSPESSWPDAPLR